MRLNGWLLTLMQSVGEAIIAFLPSTAEMGVKNSWLPNAIGSIGVITVLSSMVGFVAVWREQSILLLVSSVFLLVRLGPSCYLKAKQIHLFILHVASDSHRFGSTFCNFAPMLRQSLRENVDILCMLRCRF
jgi:hypothetical protein